MTYVQVVMTCAGAQNATRLAVECAISRDVVRLAMECAISRNVVRFVQLGEVPSDCAQSGELSSVKLVIVRVTVRLRGYRTGYCAIVSYRTI